MDSPRGGVPTIPGAIKNIAAGIEGLAAALNHPEAEDRSEAATCTTMRALVGLRRALAAIEARALARFHAQGAGRHDGALSTNAWLRHQAGMSAAEAGRSVKVARALDALPVAAEAHATGALDSDRLLLIHGTAQKVGVERFAPAEALLVDQAPKLTMPALRHALAAVRQAIDPEEPDREHERRENDRELFLAQTLGGIWSLHGTLTPECGAALSALLTSVTPPPTPDDGRSAPQRRHDAAHDVFRAVLDQGSLPLVGGEKPHIGVITHLTDVTGPASLSSLNPHCCPTPAACPHGHSAPDGFVGVDLTGAMNAGPGPIKAQGPIGRRDQPAHLRHLPAPGQGAVLDGGGHLPSAALQRLACDSAIYRIVFAPSGAITDVGRKQRTVPPTLRRALAARDNGCRFPTCDRPPPWCDAHHVIGWAQGGATSTDNCLMLCRNHHHLIHDGGWQLAFDGTTVTVHRPDGTPLDEPP